MIGSGEMDFKNMILFIQMPLLVENLFIKVVHSMKAGVFLNQ